jgi:hypothetical protein
VEDNNKDISQLSQCENNIFTSDFSKKEVFKIISQIEHNKAPGLDGFPGEIYQTFWDVINKDFMALFVHLESEELPLFKLAHKVISPTQTAFMTG